MDVVTGDVNDAWQTVYIGLMRQRRLLDWLLLLMAVIDWPAEIFLLGVGYRGTFMWTSYRLNLMGHKG